MRISSGFSAGGVPSRSCSRPRASSRPRSATSPARAEIALESFYNYFRTKEDVLEALLEEALEQQLRLLVSRQAQVEDVAEQVSIAHRHLLAVRAEPDWGWRLLRLEVDYQVVQSALGPRASADLNRGIETGRFAVGNPRVALRASAGALLGIVGGVLRSELAAGDDCAHAEGILRSFGVASEEAAEVSRMPLPPLRDGRWIRYS